MFIKIQVVKKKFNQVFYNINFLFNTLSYPIELISVWLIGIEGNFMSNIWWEKVWDNRIEDRNILPDKFHNSFHEGKMN